MKKEEGKDIYILGDSETNLTPVEILDDKGNLDYMAIIFSNKDISYQKGDIAVIDTSDLILGFRTERSIDLLIEKLMSIKESR
jgi:hypothetical protein